MIVALTAATLAGINLLTIVQFHADKLYAVEGRRRIPERDLLTLALLGGSPGALLARRLFRHKIRKEPFSSVLWSIIIAQTILIGAAGGFCLAG